MLQNVLFKFGPISNKFRCIWIQKGIRFFLTQLRTYSKAPRPMRPWQNSVNYWIFRIEWIMRLVFALILLHITRKYHFGFFTRLIPFGGPSVSAAKSTLKKEFAQHIYNATNCQINFCLEVEMDCRRKNFYLRRFMETRANEIEQMLQCKQMQVKTAFEVRSEKAWRTSLCLFNIPIFIDVRYSSLTLRSFSIK